MFGIGKKKEGVQFQNPLDDELEKNWSPIQVQGVSQAREKAFEKREEKSETGVIQKFNSAAKAFIPKINRPFLEQAHGLGHLNDGRLDKLYGAKIMQQTRWFGKKKGGIM